MSDLTDQENISAEKKEIDLENMTREEALEYMGLSPDADVKEIDDRFWMMSKQYRGKDDEESKRLEDEISSVFDIATGRRDRRLEAEKKREDAKKYFGKTKDEWKTFFEYSWSKILIGILVGIFVISIFYSLFSDSRKSYSIIVFGHMYFDETYVRETLKANGIDPYIGTADIVVPNDEGFTYDEVENTRFNALFYTEPQVMISDKESYPYYLTVFKDLAPINDDIMAGLSDKAKENIVPVYMSPREAAEYQNKMSLDDGYGVSELLDPNEYSDELILIGYEITDPTVAEKFGVDCMWHSRQTTLVIGECANTREDTKAIEVITILINSAFE